MLKSVYRGVPVLNVVSDIWKYIDKGDSYECWNCTLFSSGLFYRRKLSIK